MQSAHNFEALPCVLENQQTDNFLNQMGSSVWNFQTMGSFTQLSRQKWLLINREITSLSKFCI